MKLEGHSYWTSYIFCLFNPLTFHSNIYRYVVNYYSQYEPKPGWSDYFFFPLTKNNIFLLYRIYTKYNIGGNYGFSSCFYSIVKVEKLTKKKIKSSEVQH
jgi:hypothetical protein